MPTSNQIWKDPSILWEEEEEEEALSKNLRGTPNSLSHHGKEQTNGN